MPLNDDTPATVGHVRKVRREIGALRTDLYMDLTTRLDGVGEIEDEHQDRINRLIRAVRRIEKRLDALEEADE